MSKHIRAVFLVLLIAGGIGSLGARETYSGRWFGFITDSADAGKGRSISADDVRKSVAAKDAKYVLLLFGGGRIELSPPDKVAPFAAQQVFVYGSITTDSLTEGNNAEPGRVSGGGVFTINVTSITPHE